MPLLPCVLVLVGQSAKPALRFEVASVKANPNPVGPDYNNHLAYSPSGFSARHATLRRLLAEAYGVQLNQVRGPGWLDQNEYEIEARIGEGETTSREQMAAMLQRLLEERFALRHHTDSVDMRFYELTIAKGGTRLRPSAKESAGARGYYRGELRRFADYLAVQLSITPVANPNQPSRASGPPVPVIDRTGLTGTYELNLDVRPEPGADMFGALQRALREQLGLQLESRKGAVPAIVVDSAARVPTAN